MNVLLVCQAGMSTAIMCKKIQQAAEAQGQTLSIKAVGLEATPKESIGKSIVLLAPQVKYAAQGLRKEVPEEIPIMIIQSQDFGLMRGDEVYKKMCKVLGVNV